MMPPTIKAMINNKRIPPITPPTMAAVLSAGENRNAPIKSCYMYIHVHVCNMYIHVHVCNMYMHAMWNSI